MAEIKLTTKMESRIVADKFKSTWGVSLRFYYLLRNATTGWRLSELSDKKNGELLVTDSMTIGQFRKAVADQFGGQILVFNDNNYIIDDDITFAAARTWNVNIKNEIVITDNVPVDYVCRLFKATFGATLYLYDKSDSTYPAPSIEGWGKTIGRYFNYPTPMGHSSTESIKCTSDTKVADFISSMEKTFGILAKIGNAKGELLKSNNITISDAKKADGVPFNNNIASPLWYIEKLGSQFKSIYGVSLKYDGSNYRLNQNSNNSNAKYDLTTETTVGEFCNTINTIFGRTIAVVDSLGNIIPGNINLADASKWKFDPSKGFQIIPGMPIDWLNNRLYDKLIVAKLGNGSSLYNKTAKYITCTDDMTVDKLKKEIKSCYGNDIDFLSITEKPIPGNLTLGGLSDYVRENGFDITSYMKTKQINHLIKNVFGFDIVFMSKGRSTVDYDCELNDTYEFGQSTPHNGSIHCNSKMTIGDLTKGIKNNLGIDVAFVNGNIGAPDELKLGDIKVWEKSSSFLVTSMMKQGVLRQFFKNTFELDIFFINQNHNIINYENDLLNDTSDFGNSTPRCKSIQINKNNTIGEFVKLMKEKLNIDIVFSNKDGIGIPENITFSKLKNWKSSESFMISGMHKQGSVKRFFSNTFNSNIIFIGQNQTIINYDNDCLNDKSDFGNNTPICGSLSCTCDNTVGELINLFKENLKIDIIITKPNGIGISPITKIGELKECDTTESFMICGIMKQGVIKEFLKTTYGLSIHYLNSNHNEVRYDNDQLNDSSDFGSNIPRCGTLLCSGDMSVSTFVAEIKKQLGITVEIEGDQNRTLDRDLPKKPKKAEKNEVSAKEGTTEKKQEVKSPTAESPKPSPKTMRQSPKPKQDSTSETTRTPVREAVPAQEPTPAPQQEPQPVSVQKSEPKSPASNTGVDPTAKFAFNGTPYNIKGRLCHDIVKFYVEQHPNVKLEQLKQIFNVPKCDVIVEMLDKAMQLFDCAGKAGGCHYVKKEDQIKINEGMVVVWNYWPERYYPDFMNNVKKLGYEVETRETVKSEEPVETPKKTPSVEDLFALDKLIDAALEDFVLTDEERKLLMNKVDTIGMDREEFALILSAKIDKRMKEKPAEETTDKKKGFFARLFGK